MNSEDMASRAMHFALEVHADQRRRYTDAPYHQHLAEVAGIAASVAPSDKVQLMVAVAWLHDSIEDQGHIVTPRVLFDRFGISVMHGVNYLTDSESGNRAARKAAARVRLSHAPGWVQTIKVADCISNMPSIVQHDPKFATVFLAEIDLLLEVLTKADPGLLSTAVRMLSDSQWKMRPE